LALESAIRAIYVNTYAWARMRIHGYHPCDAECPWERPSLRWQCRKTFAA
jgi:hypothetical protein